MQIFPLVLMALIERLPESPRFYVLHGRHDEARTALDNIYPNDDDNDDKFEEMKKNHEQEESVTYTQMHTPSNPQFHPTMITYGVQIAQALTGYGAVSIYGAQIFELLGFSVMDAEYLTQANYLSYLALMTFAWLLIDAVGRRVLMISNSIGLTVCFFLLTVFGGLSMNSQSLHIPNLAVAIPGCVALFVATGNFGIGWLATVWLIPTEIFPTTARAQGTAISVIMWGIMNFIVTLLTPILFNNLNYWIFLIFGVTNLLVCVWTYEYLPETGGRSFEENQEFFKEAKKAGSWRVKKVADGDYKKFPTPKNDDTGETQPLLSRVQDQI